MFTLLPRLLTIAELKQVVHGKIHINAIYYDTRTILCAKKNKMGLYLTDPLPQQFIATHVLGPSMEIYTLNQADLIPWTIKHVKSTMTTTYMLPYSMNMIGKIIHL